MDETAATRKLLILDLDETLIYADTKPLGRPADFRAGPYFVHRRPHVDAFLAACLEWFEVAVWTSSSPSYAAVVVRHLVEDPGRLAFVWASERCTWSMDRECGEYRSSKNLRKVKKRGYRLEEVIVVDDSPEKHRRSYGNLVRVAPYYGRETDDELPALQAYLERLRAVENVRAVEKRGWRSTVQGTGSSGSKADDDV
jgi:RNA polymerase II subunit A small phosphatase-like protein